MPTTTPQDPQLEEIKKLKKIVEEISANIEREIHKPFWKNALSAFVSGLIRGVGLVIGTTIVAGLIIYALQAIVNWSALESNATNWVTDITQEGINNVFPN
ncbi:hypothetical protein KJ673_02000 [Patescibacteria group bacterium]|nr:hypothetical protein [Patescibacteria group bacterium]MBU4452857.1 hypothetical protein [Patescibacteria group bacterium]